VTDDVGEIVCDALTPDAYIEAMFRQLDLSERSPASVERLNDGNEWAEWVGTMLELEPDSFSYENVKCALGSGGVPIVRERKLSDGVVDLFKRLYASVRPCIPNRIHLAIRVLIKGR